MHDHLVFDLDGTLSDPAEGIERSINHALEAYGYPRIDRAEVSRYIGPPLDESFRTLAQTESDAHVAELVTKYRERYADLGYAENRLYPGVTQAIEQLVERGVPLGVCTGKRADFAEKILVLFGLRQHFTFVSGGDIGISKRQQLQALLAAGEVAPGAVMIGDRAVDILAARANGLAAVGVLWGHGSEPELQAAAPDRLLSEPNQLAALRPEN